VKRYLVFSFMHYYPAGGWDDFLSAHDDLDEAKEAAGLATATRPMGLSYDQAEVVDLETLEVVPR
jgi:hypothetical protein